MRRRKQIRPRAPRRYPAQGIALESIVPEGGTLAFPPLNLVPEIAPGMDVKADARCGFILTGIDAMTETLTVKLAPNATFQVLVMVADLTGLSVRMMK